MSVNIELQWLGAVRKKLAFFPYELFSQSVGNHKMERMRNLAIFVLIISLVSCNQAIEKNTSSIETFEKILGEPETTYLNEIIDDLDNYLALNYPDHKSRFKSYLVDIPELNLIDFYRIDSTKLIKCRESNLFGQYVSLFPDSVWYDGLTFYIKFPNTDLIQEMLPLPGNGENSDIDSIITALENKPEFVLTEQSRFILALDSIKQSDSLISTYLEAKEAVGDLTPSTLSIGIKHYLNDNNEYFAKRILMMDLYERLRITVANIGYECMGLRGTETLLHFETPPQGFYLKAACGSRNKKHPGFLIPTTS